MKRILSESLALIVTDCLPRQACDGGRSVSRRVEVTKLQENFGCYTSDDVLVARVYPTGNQSVWTGAVDTIVYG